MKWVVSLRVDLYTGLYYDMYVTQWGVTKWGDRESSQWRLLRGSGVRNGIAYVGVELFRYGFSE